jgi:hypothetical protein
VPSKHWKLTNKLQGVISNKNYGNFHLKLGTGVRFSYLQKATAHTRNMKWGYQLPSVLKINCDYIITTWGGEQYKFGGWAGQVRYPILQKKNKHLMQSSLEKQGQAVLADWYKYSGGTHPLLIHSSRRHVHLKVRNRF